MQEELKRAKGVLQSDVGAVGVGLDWIYGVGQNECTGEDDG